jgi:hypothetical protein
MVLTMGVSISSSDRFVNVCQGNNDIIGITKARAFTLKG